MDKNKYIEEKVREYANIHQNPELLKTTPRDWLRTTLSETYTAGVKAGAENQRTICDEHVEKKVKASRDSEQNRLFSILRHLGVEHDAKEIMRVSKEWEAIRSNK